MPGMSFEHGDEARRALRAIVSDPAHGTDALSEPQTLSNLLHDLLPDAPREAGVLTAAAEQDLAGKLRDQVSQGLDVPSAIRLTAASFATSTAFTPEACAWAAGELALAAGLASPLQVQESGPGSALGPATEPDLSAAATERPARGWSQPDTTEPLANAVTPGGGDHKGPARPAWGRRWLWALAVVAAAAIAVAAVALVIRKPPAPRRVANPASSSHSGRSSHSRATSRAGLSSPRSTVRNPAVSSRAPVASGPNSPSSPRTSAGASAAPSHGASSSPPAAHSPAPSAASPRAVVQAYIAAINQHDWPTVWRLGGRNFSSSYAQMIAGYRRTARDVITSLTVHGDTVTARMLAYLTTGAVQTYLLQYVVADGVIVAGHGTLLGTSG